MNRFLILTFLMFCVGCEPVSVPEVLPTKVAENQVSYQEYLASSGYGKDDLVVILLDASGSMAGSKIDQAKESIKLFIDRLSTTNVGLYVFDGHGERWLAKPGKYDSTSLKTAINGINANGGTPLGSAMNNVFDGCFGGGYNKITILIVTDGEANNYTAMTNMAKNIIDVGFYLDVIGYELSADHSLKQYASRYRNASETTLTNVLLEAIE